MTTPPTGVSLLRQARILLLIAISLSTAFMASCTSCNRHDDDQGDVVVGAPGVSVAGASKLLIALPIDNNGKSEARDVRVTELTLAGGTRELPATLPYSAGDIAPKGRAVVELRFDVPGLNPSNTYTLEVEGRYRERGDDGERERRFKGNVKLLVPPTAPGSAPATGKTGTTHKTNGPYPALPQPPQTDDNERRPPTPQGAPQVLHPPTPKGATVMNWNSGGGGAAVGFVINSQTNGVYNNFPPDPNGMGASNKVVMVSGNLYIKYSTDGGSTFTTINNLSTVFGDQPDGGYCCDQVLQYIPSLDLIVWLIQTNQKKDAKGNVTGPNSQRIAWAKASDVASNFNTAWTWFDVSSTFLGLGNDWLDFPDMSVSNGFLYISTDDVTQSGLVVARISFADLQKPAGSTVTWFFTDPTKSTNATGSHLTQNAAGTMYWAGHKDTSNMRVFSWPDSSNTYSWTDLGNTTYSNSDYTSEAPDGQYWLDPRVKGDAVLAAAFVPKPGGNQIWFGWTSARDSTFKQPYVRMLWLDENLKNVGEFETWNSDYVFSYPAFAVNSQKGEVATSMMYGGNDKYYMNNVVGFPLDYLLYITTNSDVTFTQNPAGATGCDDASGGKVSGRCTRSGDYLGVRRVGANSGLFGSVGYETNLLDSSKSTDCLKNPGCQFNERWIEFGRPDDLPPPPPRIK